MKNKIKEHKTTDNPIRGLIIKNIIYLIVSLLVVIGNLTCTKETLVPTRSKIEAVITDYHNIYTDYVQIYLEPSACKDNSFNFSVLYFDKQFNKRHYFDLVYYGFKKQKSPVNGRLFCSQLSSEEKKKFTPYFSSSAYYEEDDVASTFYILDTNKVNKFDVDFDNKFQHRIKFDLNLVKTRGPGRDSLGLGIDSFHIIAPEFAAKVWFWH